MTSDSFNTVLLFIGAILAAVMFVLERTNRRATDSLPPAFLPLLPILINALVSLAQQTPSTLDDELIDQLRKLLATNQQPPAVG